MHQFHKFILAWKSTCFGQLLYPSSGVYSLYTQQYRSVDSFRAGSSWSCSKAIYKPVWHIPLLSVQWINSWWWIEELSETCRVSRQNKFVKLVHLVGFIIKKFVTIHGYMNIKYAIAFSNACSFVRAMRLCDQVMTGDCVSWLFEDYTSFSRKTYFI